MSAKYKIIFREENGSGGETPLKWELEAPLAMNVVQISRNTETSESYLQVKVLNISAKMIGEVHAEADVRYPDGTSEKLSLDDLDADIKPGDAYTFNAVKLSRGDATRADVVITRIRLSDGASWESRGRTIDIAPGDAIELPSGFSTARLSYLADAGCNDVSSAVRKVNDQSSYWVCSCGQVNLSGTCARCKLDKQAALNSENVEFLEKVIADKKEAAEKIEKEKQQKKGKVKRIGVIIGIVVVAIIAAFAIASQIPQCNGTLTSGSGKGAYVMVKESYVSYEGKDTVVEYELSEHGNAIKVNYVKPDNESYSYKYDDFGIQVECKGGEFPWKKTVDATDSHGQPTKMTLKYNNGNTTTVEIEWYGEGHVKQVTQRSKSEYSDDQTTWYYNESGELTKNESTYKYSGYGARSSWHSTTYTYKHDSNGQVTSRTGKDEDGKTTNYEFEYDSNGNIIKTYENGKLDSEREYVYVEDVSPAIAVEQNHFLGVVGI